MKKKKKRENKVRISLASLTVLCLFVIAIITTWCLIEFNKDLEQLEADYYLHGNEEMCQKGNMEYDPADGYCYKENDIGNSMVYINCGWAKIKINVTENSTVIDRMILSMLNCKERK